MNDARAAFDPHQPPADMSDHDLATALWCVALLLRPGHRHHDAIQEAAKRLEERGPPCAS